MKTTGIRSPRILLVDDNPGDARLVAEAFRAVAPAAVLSVAADGVEALQRLRCEGKYATAPAPDLILLDLRMPGKNGFEVLAEVKQDPHLRSIPVVVFDNLGRAPGYSLGLRPARQLLHDEAGRPGWVFRGHQGAQRILASRSAASRERIGWITGRLASC